MPTRNSQIISARISDETLTKIKERISRNGKTLNAWLNWAIQEALRSHKKR